MRFTGNPSRRAAALLIVLATLILTTTAATIVVRSAVTHQIDQRLDQCGVIADDLLSAAEAPILDWLSSQALKVVLPPEVLTPEVTVLHDRWYNKRDRIELTITAWDQCGMVPLNAVYSGSPLRLSLSDEILRQIALHPHESKSDKHGGTSPPYGLDQFLMMDDEDQPLRLSPFPSVTTTSNLVCFGDQLTDSQQPEDLSNLVDAMPCIGALIATHNPLPVPVPVPGAGAGGGSINVNTAPMPLVEAAFRGAGRGGVEQVIAARRAGKPAAIGAQINPSIQPDQLAPQLVTASNSWAFRIDINVGPLKRSWWAIYKQSSNQWECLQRLVISH
jgi:hypothetical protein